VWIFASQGQAQPSAELTGAFCRNANRARVATMSDPAEGDEARAQCRAEGAGNVGAALGPVHALSCEAATRAPQGLLGEVHKSVP